MVKLFTSFIPGRIRTCDQGLRRRLSLVCASRASDFFLKYLFPPFPDEDIFDGIQIANSPFRVA